MKILDTTLDLKSSEQLSRSFTIPLDQSKYKGMYGIGFYKGEKVVLLKPLTYMNLSGEVDSSND